MKSTIPSAYLAPDVVLDVTDVMVEQLAPDRVRVTGARGKPAPETLKATVCVDGGCLARQRFPTPDQMRRRERGLPPKLSAHAWEKRAPDLVFRIDAIGVVSVLGENGGTLSRPWPPMRPMYGCGSRRNRQWSRTLSFCLMRSKRSIARGLPAVRACVGG